MEEEKSTTETRSFTEKRFEPQRAQRTQRKKEKKGARSEKN
jgi:hypothetical protein